MEPGRSSRLAALWRPESRRSTRPTPNHRSSFGNLLFHSGTLRACRWHLAVIGEPSVAGRPRLGAHLNEEGRKQLECQLMDRAPIEWSPLFINAGKSVA